MKNETEPKALTQKELDKVTDGWITRNTVNRKYDCATNFHRLGNVDNTSSKDQSENALSYKKQRWKQHEYNSSVPCNKQGRHNYLMTNNPKYRKEVVMVLK